MSIIRRSRTDLVTTSNVIHARANERKLCILYARAYLNQKRGITIPINTVYDTNFSIIARPV